MEFVKVENIFLLPSNDEEFLCRLKEQVAEREEFVKLAVDLVQGLAGRPEEHLVRAICVYLITECRLEEATLVNVIKLICCDSYLGSSMNDEVLSTLGIIFNDLAKKSPDHVVVKHYANYQKAMFG